MQRKFRTRYSIRFSPDAIYAWVRSGLIPASCVSVSEAAFESTRMNLIADARRQTLQAPGATDTDRAALPDYIVRDNHTSRRKRRRVQAHCEHRFMDEGGAVAEIIPIRRRCRPRFDERINPLSAIAQHNQLSRSRGLAGEARVTSQTEMIFSKIVSMKQNVWPVTYNCGFRRDWQCGTMTRRRPAVALKNGS